MTRARWLAAAAAVVAAVIVVIAVIVLRDERVPESPAELATPVERPRRPGSAGATGSAAGALGEAEHAVAERRYAEALPLLEQAYAKDPQPATLLELASVDLALGRCREAKRAAQRVVAANVAELAEPARQLLARIGHCD